MSVLAHSNKQILWEVLNGLISDNKLKIKDTSDFRKYFEHKCKEYHVKRFDFNGLSDINKQIVSECFEYLKKASQESQLLMFREYEQYGNANVVNNLQIGKRYEEHQNNFKTMINAKRPNEVDFTENTDAPIGNMDDIMSKRMKEREQDISSITNQYNQNHESIKWLNNSGDIPPKLTIHNNDNVDGNTLFDNNSNNYNLKNEKKDEAKVEKKKVTKKVKFKSDFLKNLDNDKKTNIKMEEEQDKHLKERAKEFQELNEQMNNKDQTNSKIYLEKREIIEIMDNKDNKDNKVEKEDDLNMFFTKMKKKTKDSDIEGSKKVDLIDIHLKIDKMEKYLIDVLKNQLDIMENQKDIISKIQYNQNNTDSMNEIEAFSAI